MIITIADFKNGSTYTLLVNSMVEWKKLAKNSSPLYINKLHKKEGLIFIKPSFIYSSEEIFTWK